VNESVGADPIEVLNTRLQLPVADTLGMDYRESEGEPALERRREGLPPSFRMRHDKHYVEELIASPAIAHGAASATSAKPGSPAAPPIPSAAAMELIARRLESVAAYDALSRGNAGPMDLVSQAVQVELQRVSRFARAVAINTRISDPVRRSVTAGEIAAAVRAACTRGARLNGTDCVVTTDDAGFAITVASALVVQSITGTVDALLDLIQASDVHDGVNDGDRIAISLRAVRTRPALIVDMECPSLAWRRSAADRFFDNDDRDFAAAPAAGILLASAAHVVHLHGGRFEAQLQRGVSVRYVFPQEAPRAAATS
jgi:hypothetical protein